MDQNLLSLPDRRQRAEDELAPFAPLVFSFSSLLLSSLELSDTKVYVSTIRAPFAPSLCTTHIPVLDTLKTVVDTRTTFRTGGDGCVGSLHQVD